MRVYFLNCLRKKLCLDRACILWSYKNKIKIQSQLKRNNWKKRVKIVPRDLFMTTKMSLESCRAFDELDSVGPYDEAFMQVLSSFLAITKGNIKGSWHGYSLISLSFLEFISCADVI